MNRRFETELSSKTKYTFSFDNIDFIEAKNKLMSVLLYNATTKTVIDSHIFDLNYCNQSEFKKWTFITPNIGTDDLQLLIYAGEVGKTSGNILVVENAKLTKYE